MEKAPSIAKIIAKRFSESGTILYLKSIIESAKSIKKLIAAKKPPKVIPYFEATKKKIIPLESSIKGYCIEILLLQYEHLPAKKSHDTIGILCHGLSGVLQDVQCDAVKTTLSPLGIRKITTFKNEPNSTPKRVAKTNSIILTPQTVVQLF